MTSEELKEIEERARKASSTFALDFMKREDFDYMNRGRSDVYKLLNYIKELESQIPRWIPVEERWPEKDGIYLVFDPTIYEIDVLWFALEMSGLPTSKTKEEWETVSHWQPLPKGPEE